MVKYSAHLALGKCTFLIVICVITTTGGFEKNYVFLVFLLYTMVYMLNRERLTEA